MRIPVAVIALAFLALNLVAGQSKYGATLWIQIGSLSIQPSEIVKVAYIYFGAASLEHLFRTRNLIVFIVFSALCVIVLGLLGDFGTALIFFMTFLVISFMRSGSIATVALAITGAAMGGFLIFTIKPHVASRFAAWGQFGRTYPVRAISRLAHCPQAHRAVFSARVRATAGCTAALPRTPIPCSVCCVRSSVL